MRRFRGRVGAIGFGLLVLAGGAGVTVRTVAQDPSLFRTGTEDSKTPSRTPAPAPAAPALPAVRPPTAPSPQPASPQPAPAAPSVSGSPAPGRSVDPRVVERITVDKAERSGGASTPAPRASVNPEPGARDAAIGGGGGAKASAAPSAANGIKDEEASRAMKELGVGRMGAPAADPESEESKLAEIKGLVKATRKTMEEGKAELADRYLESIVAVQMPDAAKKAALREVAELYESHGDRVKAAAIYEKLCTLMENDTEMPLWLVKLGVLYRESGAYQLAISRFYGVINMAIKVGGRDFESQQGIARKAQREIADTHFLKGDFEQAQKFYNMALRSELSKEDRAMVLFRAGHCTFMRDDPAGAVAIFERFLK
ncbi:MAG: hypothetical protein RLZZ142_823, partial [Verrucomicrobiota bacterium]